MLSIKKEMLYYFCYYRNALDTGGTCFLFNHLYHRRVGLIVYLRSRSNKVPGLYGPTADDRM